MIPGAKPLIDDGKAGERIIDTIEKIHYNFIKFTDELSDLYGN
jgi:hypothetical protein